MALDQRPRHHREPAQGRSHHASPATKNAQLLYSFLCSINYYRQLIPNYGSKTAELYRLAENKLAKTVTWTDELVKKFTVLKEALVVAPILKFPNFEKPFTIQTDASGYAFAGVLLQDSDGILAPISFASRKLTATEQRYSASEREMLAIIYSYNAFYSYIFDRPITILTDHQPLVTMTKLKNPMSRLGRLFHKLHDVKYKLICRIICRTS